MAAFENVFDVFFQLGDVVMIVGTYSEKVDYITLIIELLHSGDGQNHHIVAASPQRNIVRYTFGDTHYPVILSVASDQEPAGIGAFFKKSGKDILADNANFTLLADVDFVDVPAIEHILLFNAHQFRPVSSDVETTQFVSVHHIVRAPASKNDRGHISDSFNLRTYKVNVRKTDIPAPSFFKTGVGFGGGAGKENMPIKLTIGALNDRSFDAKLEYISPKGTEESGAILFEIKAAAKITEDIFVRAGYSANAEIVLQSVTDVLSIPESSVEFSGDTSFVYVLTNEEPQQFEKRSIEIGLSDGIYIEVKEGLDADSRLRGAAIDPKAKKPAL
jgi:hypothetical protein